MSALALFSLKHRSLLQFNDIQSDENVRHNLKQLFFVDRVPSDTYMRERLDHVDPKVFQGAFKACFRALQRGKMLPLFHFLDDYVLVSCDATGFFHSNKVHCQNCCIKRHRDGSLSYYHNMLCAVMVSPNQKEVIPLGLETISNEHGHTKNDSEHSASQRLLTRLRNMHPLLKMLVVEDALYGTAPHIRNLIALNYRYIIGVKPKRHDWLFDYVNASDCNTITLKDAGKIFELHWLNNAPLNASNEDLRVNFFKCIEISPDGKRKTFTWITSFTITKNNIFRLMKGARSRWKVENETFNTLKTQGYHFEHNFGHGYQQLSSVMGSTMILAFLIDQLQQLCCPFFQKALIKCRKRIRLWDKMREWFLTFYIDDWEAFFSAIADPPCFRLRKDSG